jgi:large subunit ribosomal protein L4
MAQATVYSKAGAKKETPLKLSASIFGVSANHDLLNQAYNAYLAKGRTNNARTLERGEVRGGGKKPWKQKGTGRARAGGTRMPHWRGGGVAFGPTGIENYSVSMPVKAKRAAVRQALSVQANDKKIVVLESFDGGEGKVKPTVALLDKLKLDGRVLLVVADKTAIIDRATRNIPGVTVQSAKYLNVYTILSSDCIVMTSDAHTAVIEWLEK